MKDNFFGHMYYTPEYSMDYYIIVSFYYNSLSRNFGDYPIREVYCVFNRIDAERMLGHEV